MPISVDSGKNRGKAIVVPVNRKNISLAEEARTGLVSLVPQGGVVLGAFAVMLLLTGGAPSGLAVVLTVVMSGAFVTWSEQHRLTKRHRISRRVSSKTLEETAQEWIEQYIPEEMSPNKTAILRLKLAQLTSQTKTPEQINSLVKSIEDAEDNFLMLAKLVDLDPFIDFVGCNLQKVNLRDLNLSEANLSEANLSRTNLSGVNLSRANLRKVNLNGADLSRANLSEAYLGRAYLIGANLSEADLGRAYLGEAYLSGAEVKDTRFVQSVGISPELKHNLEERGAIFEDSPGDRGKVLVPH
ncbi:MAG: pentapeptide repeat-containing protein [Acaryochloris sp. SU_5_25]|nr:pentapeptide repeat-containing protein [Acaryochloris sp. SU_5_25]